MTFCIQNPSRSDGFDRGERREQERSNPSERLCEAQKNEFRFFSINNS